MLTTQLKNQNPLDPLDTNQFTQQLVQFAQVEQQMKSNDQLASLVSLSKSARSDNGAGLCRRHCGGGRRDCGADRVRRDLAVQRRQAGERHHHDQGSDRTNRLFRQSGGQSGRSEITWDGRGNDGKAWPAGNYTLTATAVDASNQSVAISTEVQAVVDSVDLTQTPPLLSIAGKDYTMDKIKRVLRYVPPVEPPATDPPPTTPPPAT